MPLTTVRALQLSLKPYTPRPDASPHVCLRVPSLSTSDEEIDRRVAEYYAARPAAAQTAKARPSDLLVAPNGAR